MSEKDGGTDVLAHVAANLRRIRAAAAMSQTTLAKHAGISRRTIIKLEAGEANVSLSGLEHIAHALGVSFVDLVASATSSRANINEIAWRGVSPDSHATLLGTVPAHREAQLWSWSLTAGERYDAEPDTTGSHAIVVVTEGQLRIDRQDNRADLTTGDHCVFPSDQRFSYINTGDTLARFIRIVAN